MAVGQLTVTKRERKRENGIVSSSLVARQHEAAATAADSDMLPRCRYSQSRNKSKHQGSAGGILLVAAAAATTAAAAAFTDDSLNSRATATPAHIISLLLSCSRPAPIFCGSLLMVFVMYHFLFLFPWCCIHCLLFRYINVQIIGCIQF